MASGGKKSCPHVEGVDIKYHPESFGMKLNRGIWCFESTTEALLDGLKEFPMRPTDLMVVSYPKAGVYLLAEAVYAAHHGANMAENRKSPIVKRMPFLEHTNRLVSDPLGTLAATPEPRLCKSHLAADFYTNQLDKSQPRVIVLLRNPKDTLAALFTWYKEDVIGYPGDFNDFFNLFKAKMLLEGDVMESALSWWRLRNQDNVLVLKYEDMVGCPEQEIQHIAKFCGKEMTAEDVKAVADFVKEEVDRDGKVGMWREYFTKEQLNFLETRIIGPMAKEGLVFSDTL